VHVRPEQPLLRQVDPVDEFAPDERPVRLWMIDRQTDVLVEQHGTCVRERHLPAFVGGDQPPVRGQR
jgi:hypothetical protein